MTHWSCYDCATRDTGEQAAMNRAAEKHTKTAGHTTAVYDDPAHTPRHPQRVACGLPKGHA